VTEIRPFVITDSKEVPTFLVHNPIQCGGGVRVSDLIAAEHAVMLTEPYLKWRGQPMAVPASTMFRTTGTVRMPRIRTSRAEALARSNTRHMLGCLVAVGYPRELLSLDFFAYEEVCRGFLVCLEERRLGAERRYQVMIAVLFIASFCDILFCNAPS
jgi:hypothetical protein